MERQSFNRSETANLSRWQRVRQAGLWLGSAFRGRGEAKPPVAPTRERRYEASGWGSPASERATPDTEDGTSWKWFPHAHARADSVIDPGYNNALYPANDVFRSMTSKAEFDAWIAEQRGITPPKTLRERLEEIAASEPFTEHEQVVDAETGRIVDWQNSPQGVYPEPVILPRPLRPETRDPNEPDFFFDCNDGAIKERMPDGSVQFTFQMPSQWDN